MNLQDYVRDYPDWPKPGVTFRDINPLLNDPQAFTTAIVRMTAAARLVKPNAIFAVESRGFLFGAPLALSLDVPLYLIRKKGKLPGPCHEAAYELEYGEAILEAQAVSVTSTRILIVDDVVATGGTIKAVERLAYQLKSTVVGACVLIDVGLSIPPDQHSYPILTQISYREPVL